MICTKDKWQVLKGLRGVLMFSLCFLLSTEKVSGDSRKNSHERKITETDRGRGRGRGRERAIETRPWWSMHVLLSVLVLCPQGRRQRRGGKWCIWTVFRPLIPNTWLQAWCKSNCPAAQWCVMEVRERVQTGVGHLKFVFSSIPLFTWIKYHERYLKALRETWTLSVLTKLTDEIWKHSNKQKVSGSHRYICLCIPNKTRHKINTST